MTTAEEIGNQWHATRALNDLGYVAYLEGDCRTARSLLEQSLEKARQFGHGGVLAVCRFHLAEVADTEGSYAEAEALLKESLAHFQELGFRHFIALVLLHQGRVALHQGDLVRARSQLAESLVMQRHEWSRWIAESLENLGGVCLGEQRPERAARLFGAAAARREALGIPIPLVHRGDHEKQVEAVRAALGEEAFAAAWAEGRALSLEDAITEALKEAAGD